MSKSAKTIYICGECGYESGKWLGRCPGCDSWNTMIEEAVGHVHDASKSECPTVTLEQIKADDVERAFTSIKELDRVLGGGVVPGSVILLGGDPGVGKSTLLMQAASELARHGRVLYVTGEESAAQLKLRAQRLSVNGSMLILTQTNLSAIEAQARLVKPDYLIIDSIQTMYSSDLSGAAGSVSQVREATSLLTRYAKSTGCAVFIVGHVTKEGAIAGPRVLEHMVDTVLYFEGERLDVFRILRAVKNRFGSTNEIGVFEMKDTGMQEVIDPSDAFLSHSYAPGCAVTCAMEGTRPLLVEVQSLLCSSVFSNPRRMTAGMDVNRLSLLLAVLEKKASMRIGGFDVYLNVVGGFKLVERASDLAIALCVASALVDKPLPRQTAVIGEISLTGDVRSTIRLERRILECVRLGFENIIIPSSDSLPDIEGANLLPVRHIAEAVSLLHA